MNTVLRKAGAAVPGTQGATWRSPAWQGSGSWALTDLSRCPGSLRNPARSSPLSTASRGSQCVDSCPGGTTYNTEEAQGVAGQSRSPAFSGRTENPLISHHPETCVSKGSHFNSGLVITFSHLHSPCTHPQCQPHFLTKTENTQAGPSPEKGR